MNLSRQQRRALERATDAAMAAFDRTGCARCGRQGMVAMLAERAGRVTALCTDCAGDEGERLIGAVQCADAASAADREWFAAHPDATYRTRDAAPGELQDLWHREAFMRRALGQPAPEPPPDLPLRVLVAQIAPGRRIRVAFSGPAPSAEAVSAMLARDAAQIAARESAVAATGGLANWAQALTAAGHIDALDDLAAVAGAAVEARSATIH